MLACDTLHPLPPAHCADAPQARPEAATWAQLEAIIVTHHHRATPLLLAALGELVAERSGVLNLGVEGMMIMGAVCGFIAGYETGQPIFGMRRGDRRPAC